MRCFLSKSSGKRDLLTLLDAAVGQYTCVTGDRKAGELPTELHLGTHKPSNRERHFHCLFVI